MTEMNDHLAEHYIHRYYYNKFSSAILLGGYTIVSETSDLVKRDCRVCQLFDRRTVFLKINSLKHIIIISIAMIQRMEYRGLQMRVI